MGCVYRRGRKLWLKFKDPKGKWAYAASGFEVGQEPLARKVLERLEVGILDRAAGHGAEAPAPSVIPTLAAFAEDWIAERRSLGIRSWRDNRARLQQHVLPVLGAKRLDTIRVGDVRSLVRQLRQSDLAPKTIRNIYGNLRTLFRDALVEELVTTSPCVLRSADLGPMMDKDPTWRAGAVYTRDELQQLISDEKVPMDRRLGYALIGVAGLRTGEAMGLRWARWDPTLRPLGRLEIVTSYDRGRTKTGRHRLVPVHPALAAKLAEWKSVGWPAALGREPTPEDLVLPTVGRSRVPDGRLRDASMVWHDLRHDLATLGLRERRVHDLRRTFVSLARGDGARKDLLESVTHGARGDIVDVYTEFPWASLCTEVAKLQISVEEHFEVVQEVEQAEVIELRAAAGSASRRVTMPVTLAKNPPGFRGVVWRPQRDLNPCYRLERPES